MHVEKMPNKFPASIAIADCALADSTNIYINIGCFLTQGIASGYL